MARWRKRVGEAGAEDRLRETIQVGLRLNLIERIRLARDRGDYRAGEERALPPTSGCWIARGSGA